MNYRKQTTIILMLLATIDLILTFLIIENDIGYEINILPSLLLNSQIHPIISYPIIYILKLLTIYLFYCYSNELIKKESNLEQYVKIFYVLLLTLHFLVVLYSLDILLFRRVLIDVSL